jgi:hypothetical protein
MKQTAVEWLVEQYKKVGGISISMAEIAKEMEREQITYCYDFVSSKICTQCDDFKTGEQYYKETFKNTEQ